MLRVALVGIGDAGKHHARALGTVASEDRLVWSAVCARDEKRLAAFRAELAMPDHLTVHTSLEALLEAGACDAVILATPDGAHADQIVRATAAGVHVLVEKPLALTLADGERALSSARRASVSLAVGYHLRHHGAHRVMQERLDELVGEVHDISVRWAWPDPAIDGWRARGNGARFWSLAALGTHGIDLAMMFARSSAATDVAAVLKPPPAEGADRAAEVSLRLGAVLAHVSVSVEHRAVSRVSVTGTRGELLATGTLGARGGGELVHRPAHGDPSPIAFEAGSPYAAQLRDFVMRAPSGFTEDASLLANLDVLDRIA